MPEEQRIAIQRDGTGIVIGGMIGGNNVGVIAKDGSILEQWYKDLREPTKVEVNAFNNTTIIAKKKARAAKSLKDRIWRQAKGEEQALPARQ